MVGLWELLCFLSIFFQLSLILYINTFGIVAHLKANNMQMTSRYVAGGEARHNHAAPISTALLDTCLRKGHAKGCTAVNCNTRTN